MSILIKQVNCTVDDWNHCFVGSTLITTNNGQIPIKDIKVGDLVLTSQGFKKVTKKHNNGLKQVCKYLMQFDKHSLYLSGTKTHHIKTDKTLTEIQHLQKGQNLYLLKSLWVENTIYTQMKGIFQKVAKDCIGLYGNILKGKFQKDTKSITTTRIHQTTELKIYRLLVEVCIARFTGKKRFKENPEFYKEFYTKGIECAKEWHKSEEGRKWHIDHGKKCWINRPFKKLICKECGKEYETRHAGVSKFCHNNCKAKNNRRARLLAGRSI